ncbi:MAG TPA: four helix bundle protein [Edaphocola sp.]|nr:four helix bundle protein [Edaphocola sp.]
MNKIEQIEALKRRTKDFTLRIIRLFQALPKTDEARIIGRQLLRSTTSVAANYRAACRARSDAEFFSKISIYRKRITFLPRSKSIPGCIESPQQCIFRFLLTM